MAIYSFPYVSISGDRKITSQNEADRLNLMEGSGVVFDTPTSFQCSAVAGSMQVSTTAGSAIIGGRAVISDAAILTILGTAHVTYPRIDVIALESNTNTGIRAGRIVLIQGAPAASPVEPALQTGAGISQIKLAAVTVPAGVESLNTSTIYDRRTVAMGKHGHTLTDITDLVNQLSGKAAAVHSHDDRYFTETEVNASLAGKAAAIHTHDDRYYTEGEINAALALKSDTSHNHDTRYYTESEVDAALAQKAAASHTHNSYALTSHTHDTFEAKVTFNQGAAFTGDPVRIQYGATLEFESSSYQVPVKFGGYYLWVDGSGRLRIKSSVPSSSTDGTVVGSQS